MQYEEVQKKNSIRSYPLNLSNTAVYVEKFVNFIKYLRSNPPINFSDLTQAEHKMCNSNSKDIPQCRTNHEFFKNSFFRDYKIMKYA